MPYISDDIKYIEFAEASGSANISEPVVDEFYNKTVTDMETKRKELGMTVAEFYAVPRDPPSDSKLPIFDEAHVRNAMARLSQTQGLSTEERATAKRKIITAAKKYKIDTTNFEGNSQNLLTSATLKIYSEIATENYTNQDGELVEVMSADKVDKFLHDNQNALEIKVKINSPGGSVQEGWAIHDLLRASGKKIITIGEGQVYSIATVVFMAGDERIMMPNADGLIHMPFIPPYTLSESYTADDLQKLASNLKQEGEKILSFYVEETGHSKSDLQKYMDEDTKLSAQDMVNLGFATSIAEPVHAVAYYSQSKTIIMPEDVKTLGEKLDTILAKFSRLLTKDQEITDKDGKKFTLAKASGDPVVGDVAQPDGTYVFASGKTVTISGGKITEVKDPAPANKELDDAKTEVERLKAELAAVKKAGEDAVEAKKFADAAKIAAETIKTAALKKETEAKALFDELSALKNSWKPGSRQGNFSSADKVGDIDIKAVKENLANEKIYKE